MDGLGSELEPAYRAYQDPEGVGEGSEPDSPPVVLEAGPGSVAVTLIAAGLTISAPLIAASGILYVLGSCSGQA